MKSEGQFGKETWRLGLAAALLAVGLVGAGLDLAPAGVRAATLSPAELYRAADRQAHEFYATAARVASDLRLVYEIHARLDELGAVAAAKASAPDAEKTSGTDKPLRCTAAAVSR